MHELVKILAENGYPDNKTYIQSGNIVFSATQQGGEYFLEKIQTAIENLHGFSPNIIILSAKKLKEINNSNPYPAATGDAKNLHFFFLKSPAASPSLAALELLKTPTESFTLTENAFYLHAPNGIGRSKLAAKVEKLIGVPTTARNWRTVSKLLEISDNF